MVCGGFGGQFRNCLPIEDIGGVAEFVLLITDLFGLSVGFHSHVAEAIFTLGEQTEVVKDADGVGETHGWCVDESNIPHWRTSGAFSGHL